MGLHYSTTKVLAKCKQYWSLRFATNIKESKKLIFVGYAPRGSTTLSHLVGSPAQISSADRNPRTQSYSIFRQSPALPFHPGVAQSLQSQTRLFGVVTSYSRSRLTCSLAAVCKCLTIHPRWTIAHSIIPPSSVH